MEFIFQLWFYSIGLVLMRYRYSKVYSNMQKIGYYNVDKDDKVCWLPSLLTTTCNYKYTHTHTNKDRHTQATNIEMRQWKRRRCSYIEVSSWRFNKLTTTYYADINSRRPGPPTSMSSSSSSLLFTSSFNVFFFWTY